MPWPPSLTRGAPQTTEGQRPQGRRRRPGLHAQQQRQPPQHQSVPLPEIPSQYKPPPIWVEHRGIVIFFAILCLALAAYWIKSVRTGGDAQAAKAGPARAAAAPPEPVYIEMVTPEKGASSAP